MQDIIIFMQHHSFLSLALGACLIVLLIIEAIRYKQTNYHVDSAQLTHLVNHENAVILDLRPTALFAEGHIVDALSTPAETISSQLKKLQKHTNKTFILTCANGTSSAQTAPLLLKENFNVRILAGGMKAWREASMPVIKG